MTLCTSFKVGSLTCHLIEGGTQRLDGGVMFGVVPKPLWQKRIPADERNRITLALRCLVVEHPDGLILVDTGIGQKWDAKGADMFGVDHSKLALEQSLAAKGLTTADITDVLLTHLHFDHAGGATKKVGDAVVPTFENATYYVQKANLDWAQSPTDKDRASYRPENFDPISEAGLWDLVEGVAEVTAGIRVVPTPGHTPFHQSVMVESDGETACFLADVCPTTAHLPLPWIMGYDLEPMRTLESKKQVLGRAADEGWVLVFEHDPDTAMRRIKIQNGRAVAVDVD